MNRLRPVPDSPPRAVLYLRQSTYREESISLELQETAGRDYCARQGYQVIDVLADPGISGRTWKRPSVQRAMSMLEEREADVIVLWRWSRLSRSRKDWALAADRADVAGGRIESATEPNDVSAAGRFARGVMTELAAFESERIGEQWKEVQGSRVARGLPPGGKLPWGWRWGPGGAVEVDGDRGAVIADAYDRYLAGAGGRLLADWLNAEGWKPMHRDRWNSSTIVECLASPVHAGLIVHRGEALPGAHEGVVNEATWRAFGRERARRAASREARRKYLLSGIATCAACGSPMRGFSINHHPRQPGAWLAYRCVSEGRGPHEGLGQWSIALDFVEAGFLDWLREVADRVDEVDARIAASRDGGRAEAHRLAREVAALDRQMTALTVQLAADVVPVGAYEAARDDIMGRRERLAELLADAEAAIRDAPGDPRGLARTMLTDWEEIDVESQRALIRQLVVRVDVDMVARTVTPIPR